jgi:predicted nucleic-acid-binding Zn-ribbon protein
MTRCKKCDSKVFLVDETTTHFEIDGQIGKQLGNGHLHNRNCVRCAYPELYENYSHFDE